MELVLGPICFTKPVRHGTCTTKDSRNSGIAHQNPHHAPTPGPSNEERNEGVTEILSTTYKPVLGDDGTKECANIGSKFHVNTWLIAGNV